MERQSRLQRLVERCLLIVTFLCIIPTGFIYSQIEHVSLKKVAEESEAAGVTAEVADAG